MAAKNLGGLAGETAVPVLKVMLAKEKIASGGIIYGLGKAGGSAVPLLIRMLNDEIKESGGKRSASHFIQALEQTGDRRAIKPLLDILSRPASLSDPNMRDLQLHTAKVLAHFATDWCYAQTLKDRAKFSVVHPATPTENQKVKAPDRIRIIEALKNAGYDVDRLARGGSPMVF